MGYSKTELYLSALVGRVWAGRCVLVMLVPSRMRISQGSLCFVPGVAFFLVHYSHQIGQVWEYTVPHFSPSPPPLFSCAFFLDTNPVVRVVERTRASRFDVPRAPPHSCGDRRAHRGWQVLSHERPLPVRTPPPIRKKIGMQRLFDSSRPSRVCW